MWWSSIATGNYGSAAGVAAVFGAGSKASPARRIYAAGVLNGRLDLTKLKVLLI